MHLGTKSLLKFFRAHSDDESLVLVSITATEDSTYRKPGAMMLISRDNAYEGMISGGCLEADLLHHAAEVFSSGGPKTVTYDMHAGDELVWGLGLGCDGVIHLMLQRLDRDGGFALLDFLQQSLLSRAPVLLALVTASTQADLPAGSAGMYNRCGHSLGDDRLAWTSVPSYPSVLHWPFWPKFMLH